MGDQKGIYAFCIILGEWDNSFGTIQFDDEETNIFAIPYENTAMVCAKVPLKIYTPRKNNLLAHQTLVSSIFNKYQVIPMSFGNVFKSEDDVRLLLKGLHSDLISIFDKIKNQIEVSLKITAQKDWLESEILKVDEIKKLKNEIAEKSLEAAYFDRIRLGELAKDFIQGLQEKLEAEVFLPLSKLASQSKQNDIANERILLNAVFLVDRDKEELFDRKVNELYLSCSDLCIFNYTGPWPPYNFANIHLKIEGS
jgi:hypothetical protein